MDSTFNYSDEYYDMLYNLYKYKYLSFAASKSNKYT